MAACFELVDATDGGYRIKMLAGSGSLLAVSVCYPTKEAAVRGIDALREIGGTGLVLDHSRQTRSVAGENNQQVNSRAAVRNHVPAA